MFTEYHNMDVVVPQCSKASAHRLYIIDTPSSRERSVLYRGLISRTDGALNGGADGVILFCDARDENYPASTVRYLDECEEQGAQVLLVHRGGKVAPELVERIDCYKPGSDERKKKNATKKVSTNGSRGTEQCESNSIPRGAGALRYVVVTDSDEGFVETSKAFVQFIADVHDDLETAAVQLEKLIAEREASRVKMLSRKPPVSLPPPGAVECSWHEGHFDIATRELDVALIGAANTGKTTFVTSLIDGFILKEHLPTTSLEIAYGSMDFGGLDGRTNVTFYDGLLTSSAASDALTTAVETHGKQRPTRTKEKQFPCDALLTFIDVCDPFAIEKWEQAWASLPFPVPPHVGIIATKADVVSSSLYSRETLSQLAGEHKGFLEYLDCRVTSANRSLFSRFVAHIRREDAKTRLNLDRQWMIHTKTVNEVPHTAQDIELLFHRYDTSGADYISLDAAKTILDDSNVSLFGDSFEKCVAYLEKTYGPLGRSGGTKNEKVITKDQLGLILCRLNKM